MEKKAQTQSDKTVNTKVLYKLFHLLSYVDIPCEKCPVSGEFCHRVFCSSTHCVQDMINWIINNKELTGEIKPCHNCGSPNVYARVIVHSDEERGAFNVQCRDCGKHLFESKHNLADAIETWNVIYRVLGRYNEAYSD